MTALVCSSGAGNENVFESESNTVDMVRALTDRRGMHFHSAPLTR